MQDKVPTGYDFEEDSIPTNCDFDSPDTVDSFTTTPAADADVGGAYCAPGNSVDVSNKWHYHDKSYTIVMLEPNFMCME